MNFTVTAGPHTYRNCPIRVDADGSGAQPGEASLVDANGNRLRCQVNIEGGKTVLTWIEPLMSAGESRRYTFEAAASGASGVEIEDVGEGKLEVRIGGRVFTRYHYGAEWVRPFLYPFIGPNDTPVTRGYPVVQDIPGEEQDHPHHKSVWVAYGDVNGVDDWGEEGQHGWIRHVAFEEITSGPVFGRIRTRNDWTDRDGVKQMADVREFTFYNVGTERLMDVKVRLIAEPGNVELKGTKEGGIISVRVASSMDGVRSGLITNAYGGKTEAENWGKPAHWVDYCGQVNGKTMGITIMDHPTSFRYPSRWHVRDYGLFTANPFALRDYEPERGESGDHLMKQGEELSFAYRLLVHEGGTEDAGVGDRYFCFIAPPKAAVK